jgi:transcriptional regulator with XRE-family HTH domain
MQQAQDVIHRVPLTGRELQAKRAGARIAGVALAAKAGISRSYLCQIECGHAMLAQEDLARLEASLDELIQAKAALQQAAAALGWPVSI